MMFNYVIKNVHSQFTKQRLLSLLLVLNIVVSCLVICFSYGLYQNYNVIVLKGEEEELTFLDILIDRSNDVNIYEDGYLGGIKIPPQKLIEFGQALSDDTKNAISSIGAEYLLATPLWGVYENTDVLPNVAYKDDAEAFYGVFSTSFRIDGDRVIPNDEKKEYFTDEEFANGKNVLAISADYFDDTNISYVSFIDTTTGRTITTYAKVLPTNQTSIMVEGKQYNIVYKIPIDADYQEKMEIPITAIPEDGTIFTVSTGDENKYCFGISFYEPITREQYNEIKNCLNTVIGEQVFPQQIEFTDATEIYYYKTIMLISVVIALLAAINMAILYRYILEKRSSELAIFRICGCSKGKAIASYLIECMIINIPLFTLTQLCYHKLIMPRLTGLFPNMQGAYSLKLYAAIFGIYIGASMLVMLIMIAVTVGKHSLVDLKKSSKSTTKFSIMKVFEIVQLAAVLSMMVLIVSAIISRYSMFKPFAKFLNEKGYLAIESDRGTYPDELEDIVGNSDYIMNQHTNAFDGDLLSGNYVEFDGISYSDEFIEAYSPSLASGVWLDKADFTHANSGYIPAVITSCDGRYKVGDVLECDINMAFDENGNPINIINVKYKIIGILKDKVSIANYVIDNYIPNDYTDIYAVFSDDFEDNDWLLTKISDIYSCYGAYGPIYGAQFILCDDISDQEYELIGKRLNIEKHIPATPLSEIYDNSLDYIYEQMYTLFPIAVCIFILTIISTVSISAIYTKRQLRNYAIFYICGARWRTCALKSLRSGAMTCAVSAVLSALILIIGKATLLKETVISFGIWQLAVCAGVIILYLALSMIMPLSIIGSSEPREVLKEE